MSGFMYHGCKKLVNGLIPVFPFKFHDCANVNDDTNNAIEKNCVFIIVFLKILYKSIFFSSQ